MNPADIHLAEGSSTVQPGKVRSRVSHQPGIESSHGRVTIPCRESGGATPGSKKRARSISGLLNTNQTAASMPDPSIFRPRGSISSPSLM